MRTIQEIAAEIARTWVKPNYAAKPYLDYMVDPWGADSPRSAAMYFLSNASTWRGPDAQRLKSELKAASK